MLSFFFSIKRINFRLCSSQGRISGMKRNVRAERCNFLRRKREGWGESLARLILPSVGFCTSVNLLQPLLIKSKKKKERKKEKIKGAPNATKKTKKFSLVTRHHQRGEISLIWTVGPQILTNYFLNSFARTVEF